MEMAGNNHIHPFEESLALEFLVGLSYLIYLFFWFGEAFFSGRCDNIVQASLAS